MAYTTYGEALRATFIDFESGRLTWFEYRTRKRALLRRSKCRLGKAMPDLRRRLWQASCGLATLLVAMAIIPR